MTENCLASSETCCSATAAACGGLVRHEALGPGESNLLAPFIEQLAFPPDLLLRLSGCLTADHVEALDVSLHNAMARRDVHRLGLDLSDALDEAPECVAVLRRAADRCMEQGLAWFVAAASPLARAAFDRAGAAALLEEHRAEAIVLRDDLRPNIEADWIAMGALDLFFAPTWIVDPNCIFLRWNVAAEHATGIPREKMIGTHCRFCHDNLVIHDASRGEGEPNGRCPMKAAMQTGALTETTLTLLTPGGRQLCRARFAPITDTDGRVIGGLATLMPLRRVAGVESLPSRPSDA